MLCFLIFADNLLGRIEGHEETVWFWLRSGRWKLIFASGVLGVVCQLLFWSISAIARTYKPDKAILGMVSESPGRNASEPRSGLAKKIIRRPSPLWSGEGSMTWRRLTEAACHFGGVVGTARWQGHVEQLEKPSSPHREIGGAR